MIRDPQTFISDLIAALHLPTLPSVALQLLALRRRGGLDAATLSRLIRLDPVLTGNTINLIEQHRARASGPVPGLTTNLRTGLLQAGVNRCHGVLDAICADDQLRPVPPDTLRFPYMTFWKRAIIAAVASDILARRFTDHDPHDAWTAGLTQDIGQLALAERLGPQYLRDVLRHAPMHMDVVRQEQKVLRLTHPEVSAALLTHWSLPAHIVDAVRHHEHPPDAAPGSGDLRTVIHLAGLAASAFVRGEARCAAAQFALQASDLIPMSAAEARRVLDEIDHASRAYDSFLTMDAASVENLRSLLTASANVPPAASDHDPEADHEVINPFTGIADRDSFERDLSALLRDAVARKTPIGIIQIAPDDLDGLTGTAFDIRGRIVHVIADYLRDRSDPSFLVGYLDTETFALACPALDLIETCRLADHIRTHCPSDRPPDLSPFTLRAGVAARASDGHSALDQPHVLLRCAQDACDAARKAGGNCVRAFRPRIAA